MIKSPPSPRKETQRSLEARAVRALRALVDQLRLFEPVANEDGVSFTRNQALLDAERLIEEIDGMH